MNFKHILFCLLAIYSVSIITQDFNTVITDEKSGKPMLIGYTTLEAFTDTSFSWWWNSEYNLYEVDTSFVVELETDLRDVQIEIILGTWCSDSRREVPRLFKILDAVHYPIGSVEIISVNRDKVGLNNEVDGLQIDFVPTIIFIRNNEELGRIVEMPYETLEKDIIAIIKPD